MKQKFIVPRDLAAILWEAAESDPESTPRRRRGTVNRYVREAIEAWLEQNTGLGYGPDLVVAPYQRRP